MNFSYQNVSLLLICEGRCPSQTDLIMIMVSGNKFLGNLSISFNCFFGNDAQSSCSMSLKLHVSRLASDNTICTL